MKLRNKKTGKVAEFHYLQTDYVAPLILTVKEPDVEQYRMFPYESLAELNAYWEDYTPQEPLIKDKEIRKAIRSWAEINNITMVMYDSAWNAFRRHDFTIGFGYDFDKKDGLEDSRIYTIDELCGEEEE